MDLEGQGRIKQVVEQQGMHNVIAVLGANAPPAIEMAALTLKSGDPSYAGPLAGIELGIPSFHILEPEIVAQVDRELYERELALAMLAMDVETLIKTARTIREGS